LMPPWPPSAAPSCPEACSAAACCCSCRRAALTALWNSTAWDLLPLPCSTIMPLAVPMMSLLRDSTCRRCCTTCWYTREGPAAPPASTLLPAPCVYGGRVCRQAGKAGKQGSRSQWQ
jgi:hypothetical protein